MATSPATRSARAGWDPMAGERGPAPGVVHDEGDVAQVEVVDELSDCRSGTGHRGRCGIRETGARYVECDATIAIAELRDQAAPEQRPQAYVDHDQHKAVAAGVTPLLEAVGCAAGARPCGSCEPGRAAAHIRSTLGGCQSVSVGTY